MVVLGCTPDARSPSEPAALSASGPRATLIAELASNPAIGSPTDIAAIEMDLPELPRPYDQSDSALAAALTESSGRAGVHRAQREVELEGRAERTHGDG